MYNRYKWEEMIGEEKTAPIPPEILEMKTQFCKLMAPQKRKQEEITKRSKHHGSERKKGFRKEQFLERPEFEEIGVQTDMSITTGSQLIAAGENSR